MPLDDLISGADFADAAVGGWRYLLSRECRLKKRREWRECSWFIKLIEIVFGVIGVLISIGLLGLLVWIWAGR